MLECAVAGLAVQAAVTVEVDGRCSNRACVVRVCHNGADQAVGGVFAIRHIDLNLGQDRWLRSSCTGVRKNKGFQAATSGCCVHFKRRARLWHILPGPSPALTGTMCSAVQCYAVLCLHLVGNLAADGGVLQPRVGVQVLVQLAVIGAAW